jgi:hypothetical protein
VVGKILVYLGLESQTTVKTALSMLAVLEKSLPFVSSFTTCNVWLYDHINIPDHLFVTLLHFV